ncbi:Glutaredoxin 2 [Hyella patelloides LEGE 07179]|uniref:Glutaredoxin 2 n=1 Tax=Hyella patelloides LEGE 07179 TaxID=945734 RepID=A0A563VV87_9CYAN|nr:glutaredoxin family protein [Hyella patelloides]VEP15359.1 Glutaredoxin 2 [Hyella patelloides LEGE 07179]
MQLILYSKPGCHLCEGLQEKLAQVAKYDFDLEIRDITTNDEWFNAYQYEIPVLTQKLDTAEKPLPRLSPRASVKQLEQMLQKYLVI